jgi:hypothetical protein
MNLQKKIMTRRVLVEGMKEEASEEDYNNDINTLVYNTEIRFFKTEILSGIVRLWPGLVNLINLLARLASGSKTFLQRLLADGGWTKFGMHFFFF